LYHDARNAFPPGHRSPSHPDKMPYSGWSVSVLPYLEQPAVAAQAEAAYRATPYPFGYPFSAAPHPHLSTVVPAFLCPTDSRVSTAQTSQRTKQLVAFTSYLGVAGLDAAGTRDGILYQNSATRSTLLLGERPPSADFQFGWWYAGAGQQ